MAGRNANRSRILLFGEGIVSDLDPSTRPNPRGDEMTDHDSFNALMQPLRGGEDAAARQVFARFAGRLIGLARCQLAPRLAQRIDPEDVVQSVYKSFFVRHRDGRLEVEDWDGLWSLLTLITLRKCADRADYHMAGRRDVAREERAGEDGEAPWESALGREPSPQEIAIFTETLERLFLETAPEDRPILELSLQGLSAAEISLQLGRALRTVHRVRERVRRRLEELRQQE
jgi:DNA-directed RNA polymerase specialized sigma24 family protein